MDLLFCCEMERVNRILSWKLDQVFCLCLFIWDSLLNCFESQLTFLLNKVHYVSVKHLVGIYLVPFSQLCTYTKKEKVKLSDGSHDKFRNRKMLMLGTIYMLNSYNFVAFE